jgi:hypothetical protein
MWVSSQLSMKLKRTVFSVSSFFLSFQIILADDSGHLGKPADDNDLENMPEAVKRVRSLFLTFLNPIQLYQNKRPDP